VYHIRIDISVIECCNSIGQVYNVINDIYVLTYIKLKMAEQAYPDICNVMPICFMNTHIEWWQN